METHGYDPAAGLRDFGDMFARRHRDHDPMHMHGGMPFHGRHALRHAAGFGGRGQGRARRGDVQAAILSLLAEKSMHGYQIIQELSERSGGAWTPGPGSIYPTLQALEDQDLVTSTQEGSKRVFSLTDQGREAAEKQGETAPWDELAEASGPRLKLRQATMGLAVAARQIVHSGSDEQIEKATALIDEARKAIYLMLAE